MPTILLVEDDRFLSDTIATFLEYMKHTVERAFEGPEALEKMQHGMYDLIILDWQLPGMNGIDICQKYRDGGGTTPVLMLTGRTDKSEVEAATKAGADGYLNKPFKLNILDQHVNKFLTQSHR